MMGDGYGGTSAPPSMHLPPALEGLAFDELSRIRLLDVESFQRTEELSEETRAFLDSIGQFQGTVSSLIEMMDRLAKSVEQAKLTALGKRNLVKSVSKEREAEQLQLQALITERQAQLERLKVHHNSLLRAQQEQEAFIESFSQQK